MIENDLKRPVIDEEFKKTIQKFIKDFEKKYGVELTFPQATKIVNNKITKFGGLVA
jgi:hypothetical protein